jgi:hypothetical protein
MLKFLVSMAGGPLSAIFRYGITAASSYAIAKGVPSGVVENLAAAAVGIAPVIIGAMSATKTARAAQLIKSDSVEAIQTNAGVITSPQQAFDWTSRD